MQAVLFNGVMTGASTRSDGSMAVRISTGELIPEDKLVLFNLQNIPCAVTLKPNDADAAPPKEIKGELSTRTQSERIRSVLFVWWKQLGEPGEFAAFYDSETEKYIAAVKTKLKPE